MNIASTNQNKSSTSFFDKEQSLGNWSFYCKLCNFTFKVEWQTIFDLQEVTDGYVGFHTHETYISCPKCNKVASDQEDDFFDT